MWYLMEMIFWLISKSKGVCYCLFETAGRSRPVFFVTGGGMRVVELMNIGVKSATWLESVGIETEADLAELGVVEVYERIKAAYPEKVSLNLLWALQGALLGIPRQLLPEEMKEELHTQLE